jgi:hypothetical protein
MSEKIKHVLKAIAYLAGYWALFIVLPMVISNSIRIHSENSNIPEYILFIVMFVSPVLYVIPYKLSKIKNKL